MGRQQERNGSGGSHVRRGGGGDATCWRRRGGAARGGRDYQGGESFFQRLGEGDCRMLVLVVIFVVELTLQLLEVTGGGV